MDDRYEVRYGRTMYKYAYDNLNSEPVSIRESVGRLNAAEQLRSDLESERERREAAERLARLPAEIRHHDSGLHGINGYYWWHPTIGNKGEQKTLYGNKGDAMVAFFDRMKLPPAPAEKEPE